MSTANPNKRTLSTADLRRDLDRVLADVASNEAQVVVEQDGKPLVAIIQPDELERLRRLRAEWERPFAVIDRMRAAFADLSEDEVERDVADVISRTRASARRSTKPDNRT